MFNSKVIVVAGVIGFLLSFVTGLFSGVGFGFVLLRAIIFAISLGVLAAIIMFVFDKFLDMDSVEPSTYPTEVNVGSMVDVTVGEDELPEEDSAPGFYVDAKLASNGSSSSSNKGSTSESSANEGSNVVSGADFTSEKTEGLSANNSVVDNKPISEKTESSVQSGGFVKSDVQTMTSGANYRNFNENSSEDELDELPEFSSGKSDSSNFGSPFQKDSPLVDKGMQDAELMAQAIRTVLNKN